MEEHTESAAGGWFRVKDIPESLQAAPGNHAMPSPAEAPERVAGELAQALTGRDPIPQGVLPVEAIPEVRAGGAPEDPEDPEAVPRAHRLEDTAAVVAAALRVRANPHVGSISQGLAWI